VDKLKKAGRFLSSMQFAILLLLILIAACVLGSFISQGKTWDWYAQTYSERIAGAIIALHLDDVFHSIWFVVITAFLCVNLLFCNLLRLPALLKRWKRSGTKEGALGKPTVSATVAEVKDAWFHDLGFQNIRSDGNEEDAGRVLWSTRNRAGIWGAWVCHLGILLVIVGFGMGQVVKQEYAVYGVPGQSKTIGDTGYILTIDDFRTELREDGSASQYTADLTVRRPSDGRDESGSASVNAPASLFGMKFYQNSTGWASAVHIAENGEPLQEEVLCAGDYVAVKDKPELVIYLNAFYPDYSQTEGMPVSVSQELNNPAWLYSVYYQGQMLGMNALMSGEELTIDEYTVTFSDPQTYTLLQVKRDPLTWLALLGGIVTMLGLFLALYVQPASMWAVRQSDGTWMLSAVSVKGGALFADRFREVVGDEASSIGCNHEENVSIS